MQSFALKPSSDSSHSISGYAIQEIHLSLGVYNTEPSPRKEEYPSKGVLNTEVHLVQVNNHHQGSKPFCMLTVQTPKFCGGEEGDKKPCKEYRKTANPRVMRAQPSVQLTSFRRLYWRLMIRINRSESLRVIRILKNSFAVLRDTHLVPKRATDTFWFIRGRI